MASDEKWYFTKEQLLQSPSRKSGYDVDKELSSRQQAANFIQDMGQRLQVSQLCINTAIVYMHRFYVFHSLASFHRNAIAAAALFLAAKVEEQPRKLEHVIKVAHICLHRENPNLDTKSEVYLEQAQDLVFNENVLLQTLGFDVAIDHPHTHVVRCCQLVRASKDLAQTSYFMASNSLHLTTMCLQYKPTVVACFCIHLACKWSNWEIPRSNEGKDWFWYVDKTVTLELLEKLTGEFLAIFDKCPTKLKRKMMSMNQNNTSGFPQQSIPHDGLQFVSNFEEPRKLSGAEAVKPPEGLFPVQKQNSQLPCDKPSTSSTSGSSSSVPPSHPHHQKIDYWEYREKKERERLEREKQQYHHHQQQRDTHSSVSSNTHHISKGGQMPAKGLPGPQSRSTSSSGSHKGYPQQSHLQPSSHFQGTKESVDSNSGTNIQASKDNKDSNYLKQHPPHGEREKDNNYHGQYSQSSNIQHQSYSHKPESNYPHKDGSRNIHSNQITGSSLPQAHHSQSHGPNNQSSLLNQRDFGALNQREGPSAKDNLELQSQSTKKDMSSSIRDIIGQTLPQTDLHSMTNERKDVRDKNRSTYVYGNITSNNRPEVLKNGREQTGKFFQESTDKKVDEFVSRSKNRVFKREEEESAIDSKKVKSIPPGVTDKFDESDSIENLTGSSSAGGNNWNYDFGFNTTHVKNEKKDLNTSSKVDTASVKTEITGEKNESIKSDIFPASVEFGKSQVVHPMREVYDSKYKSHHYSSGNKSSDISQFKNDKLSAQCPSDLTKKFNDRLHDKLRKSEPDRISHIPEAVSMSESQKHHKINKDVQEKHKTHMPVQQQTDHKLKNMSSPSKYSKIKTMSRPSNVEYLKSDSVHFTLDNTLNNNSGDSDRGEKNLQITHKVTVSDDSSKGIVNVNNIIKQQKSHEFGAVSGLTGSLSDSNAMKTSKTCSIFSPDSKIPPQNILSSLEKDAKKNISLSHRISNKSSPNSTPVKSNVPMPVSISTTTTHASTSSTGSLFSPPLTKSTQPVIPRHRTSSSGSEPELIPVLTKIEETPGYENVVKEKKVAIPTPDKTQDKPVVTENSSLFDFDLKDTSKDKSADIKSSVGRNDQSHFSVTKPSSNLNLPSEIRSDLGAVIYPNNPKPAVSKSGQTFSLNEPKLSLVNSVSTVNLSGIEKMVDTSISPAKQANPYGASSSSKPNLGMKVNLNLPVSNVSSSFASVTPGPATELVEKPTNDQNTSKVNTVILNQDVIDVEDVNHLDGKKKSEKKKKKEKHKHKDKDKEKDRSERKKEKKKHKEKDKEKVKEKDKQREKDRSKEKEKHKEKEIDVVNSENITSEAPIKITIPKDKISGGLKIKISKDCLKKEGEIDSPKSGTSGELKIKISKDKFSQMGTFKEEFKGSSKKRERSPKLSSDPPHPKMLKLSDKKISSSSRSNGTDGSTRNSGSHRHSVSEKDSYIDISSLYDFPFDFVENGEGIIKTPDYDFEAFTTSEFSQDINILPEEDAILFKNSQDEAEIPPLCSPPPAIDLLPIFDNFSKDNIDSIPKTFKDSNLGNTTSSASALSNDQKQSPKRSPVKPCNNSSPSKSPDISGGDTVHECRPDEVDKEEVANPKDCYVLKNYRSILDSHSRRCEIQLPKGSSEISCSPEEKVSQESSSVTDLATRSAKRTPETSFEGENPNYYNKYFKKDGRARTRFKDDKKNLRFRVDDRFRFNEKFERFAADYTERRDDHGQYRDFREFGAESQYYYEGGDSRRLEYQKYFAGNFFKFDNEAMAFSYDINANESNSVYSQVKNTRLVCDSSINSGSVDINMQYQYGYYNNYMYTSSGYRFFGNVPFVNMSLVHQQPTPPGTVDSSVHLGPPPLPLEPPPDLPPPPETPPPKQT